MELESRREEYAERGIAVAAVSYDNVATLAAFSERADIGYPLLADPESRWIREAGLFNEDIPQDNRVHGIAHPGWLLTDAEGRVTEKVFHPEYADRTTSAALFVRHFGDGGAVQGEAATDHLTVKWSASNRQVRFGQIVTLAVEVTPRPGIHVYAPGTDGYFAVEWEAGGSGPDADTLPEAGGPLEWGEITWPEAETLHLPAIEDTAPVYTKTFRLMRNVHLPNDKALRESLGDAPEIILQAGLTYQACDDRVCFLPVTVPLEWRLGLEGHDRTRVPEELRRGAGH